MRIAPMQYPVAEVNAIVTVADVKESTAMNEPVLPATSLSVASM